MVYNQKDSPKEAPMNYVGLFSDLGRAQEALAAALADAANGRVNLVAAGHEVSWLPPMRALAVRRLDAAPDQVYGLPGGKKVALGRTFLEMLARTLRISDLSSERTDDGSVPFLAAYRVKVQIPLLDGGFSVVIGEKTVDLSDGSPAAADALGRSNSTSSLATARKFVCELAQTKARLRALRSAMSVVGALDPGQANRPWVVVTLAPHFDLSLVSQEFMDLAAAQVLGIETNLYGRPTPAPAPPAQLPPPPTAPEPEAATGAQLTTLRGWWDRLGGEAFRAHGAEALGVTMPPSKMLTAEQADRVLAHFESLEVGPQEEGEDFDG